MRDSKGIRALMYCILWAMILLVFPRSNMRYKRVSIRQLRRKPILIGIESSSTNLDFPLIGVGKFELPTLNTINGPNGYLFSYLIHGIIKPPIRRKILPHWFPFLKREGMMMLVRFVMMTLPILMLRIGPVFQRKRSKKYY